MLLLAALATSMPATVLFHASPRVLPAPLPPPQHETLVPAAAPEPPLPEPPPTLVERGEETVDARIRALSEELGKMWTRDPERLVRVIDEAARSVASAPPATLLLAIAHAETNGKILDVSEAGAVGLAQATPVAYLQEGFSGALYVTDDYLRGARAYIMKKPLNDADTIASMLIEKSDAKTRKRAQKLLDSAMKLRREGVDELKLLEHIAPSSYFRAIEREDAHNRKVLNQLKKLIASGAGKSQLKKFRDATRAEYRKMKSVQVTSWATYQRSLMARRDAMLSEHYGMDAALVKRQLPYEAGEYLGEKLDERFSAKAMARFLAMHLERKEREARALGVKDADVERLTAALYNGGSHNVRRMLAGLIRNLPETEKYMRKVPATRRRLDATAAAAVAAIPGGEE